MKKDYSKHWKSSKQRRKQRKERANAPKHRKSKFMHAHLGADLRDKYDQRSLRVREGDRVEVQRGDFKGTEGKVVDVDVDQQQVFIDGVERARRDGTKTQPPVKPSNLTITKLNKDDTRRLNNLEDSE
jgi:large subunit ribosomal protein L24